MLLNLQPPKFFTSPPGTTAGQTQTGTSFTDLIDSFGGDSWLPKEVELTIQNRLRAYGLD